MSDIHIGKITRTESGKGRAKLFYHIPIDTPVSGIAPTPTSSIEAQLQQSEIEALAAGSLVELSKNVVVLAGQTQADIADTVKTDWHNTKADCNDRYNFAYKFYGVTLNATT